MGAPGLGSSDFAYHAALYPEFQSKANEASDTVLQLIDVSPTHNQINILLFPPPPYMHICTHPCLSY